jgi:hypothetical protein
MPQPTTLPHAPTISAFDWMKTVHFLDRAATVIGRNFTVLPNRTIWCPDQALPRSSITLSYDVTESLGLTTMLDVCKVPGEITAGHTGPARMLFPPSRDRTTRNVCDSSSAKYRTRYQCLLEVSVTVMQVKERLIYRTTYTVPILFATNSSFQIRSGMNYE